MTRTLKILRFIVVLSAGIVVQNVNAKTITVNSVADDGTGSLRQALAQASNGDKINIVTNGIITLTSGELLVNKSLTINGPAPQGGISGNGISRVFHMTPGVAVTLNNLTIASGAASVDPQAAFPLNVGGGIYSDHANVTLSGCTVSNNSANVGAGIFSNSKNGGTAVLNINNSTVTNNVARSITGFDAAYGGGIFSGGGFYNTGPSGNAKLSVKNSEISGNSAELYGGGIFNDGFAGGAALTMNNCTVTGNKAMDNFNDLGVGGAIYNNGDSGIATVTIAHSDLSGNSAGGTTIYGGFSPGWGGAIYNDANFSVTPGHADITITDCTLNNNSASDAGGAVASYTFQGNTTITFTNAVLTGNSARNGNGGAIDSANDAGNARLTFTACDLRANAAFAGGGIHLRSVLLDVMNTRINGNSAADGGGLSVDTDDLGQLGLSRVHLTNCIVSNNKAFNSSAFGFAIGAGGAIINAGLELTLRNCGVSGNSAVEGGGGIFNEGAYDNSVVIENSTISGNSTRNKDGGGEGGGIFNAGAFKSATVTLINSTLSGNSADVGGGIHNQAFGFGDDERGNGIVILKNCTLSGNSSGFGGGIFSWGTNAEFGTAIVYLGNSITNAGSSGDNLVAYEDGTITSYGYNLSSDSAGGDNTTGPGGLLNATGDIRNTNPLLGPLQNNGGLTNTHALLSGSAAIDHGAPNFNPYSFNPPLIYDQRGSGFPRVVNGRVDIGAFEAAPH